MEGPENEEEEVTSRTFPSSDTGRQMQWDGEICSVHN